MTLMKADDGYRLSGILDYRIQLTVMSTSIHIKEWPMDELTGWVEPTHHRRVIMREMEPAPSQEARGRSMTDDLQLRMNFSG